MGDWGDATARVTGLRRDRYVEFEFRIDTDLEVELVMPYPEFLEFCRRHDVAVLPAEEEVALAYQQLARQHEDPTSSPADGRQAAPGRSTPTSTNEGPR